MQKIENDQTKKNSKPALAGSVFHVIPKDVRTALTSNSKIALRWNNLTPIQRNQWICWITIVKKPETRLRHIERMIIGLIKGERQPCCWPGCQHKLPSKK
jgi:uncharacterized protein YdeI (YjbR/CyaY-like superfamily)